ncbi:helix-turn-helix transcriptional regulator [uncultured Chitinophaga sp.]|uniref:helix-turn-helix transcriptional regulator n=1 Tax=uncultured Chitinophaga sp. TaxID=339340 RepID=UPI0025FE7C52|nr:helix-turn-helix transcriptional regulator [uncultured Chitinophaga sp.]
MTVKHFPPTAKLAPYIKEFLLIESDEDVWNKPLPDTSLVMAFRYKGLVQLQAGDTGENLSPLSLSGLRKSFRLFKYVKGSGNLLVIFREGGMNAFMLKPTPAHTLFDLHISAGHLFPADELNNVADQLAHVTHPSQRINIIESFLQDKLTDHTPDALVLHAVEVIKARHGIVKIKELASSLYISQDAFEKRFRTLIGASPKQFASIVRLRHLIAQYPSHASLTAASYEAGYFDQSHFIKDFKLFTGETPRQFFTATRSW